MIIKSEPTVNGFNVFFIGCNKKGTNLELKVWIDAISYHNIIMNPLIEEETKCMFLQNRYEEKQEFRKYERFGNHKIISLDELRDEFGFEPEADELDIASKEDHIIKVKALHDAISKTLTENEKIIIAKRYDDEKDSTIVEISKQLRLSERHVRRLHKQALNKLKDFLINNYPEVFIDLL